MKRRYFRGVHVVLECGHSHVIQSSWWKLSAALVGVLVGHAVRGGAWCETCKAMCHPEKVIGTCRLDDEK
jgi:hypothetical protein